MFNRNQDKNRFDHTIGSRYDDDLWTRIPTFFKVIIVGWAIVVFSVVLSFAGTIIYLLLQNFG